MAQERSARPKKRNRKRKRRNVSVSSSSSSSSSSSEGEKPLVTPAPIKSTPVQQTPLQDSDSDSSSSSSSSTVSSSSSPPQKTTLKAKEPEPTTQRRVPSRSPTPPNVEVPTLVPLNPTTDAEQAKERALKEKFRKFWMASVADGFKDDLEEIRKEPNLTTSRLSLLIDSLASGADVFSSQPDGNHVSEMEVVLDSTS